MDIEEAVSSVCPMKKKNLTDIGGETAASEVLLG